MNIEIIEQTPGLLIYLDRHKSEPGVPSINNPNDRRCRHAKPKRGSDAAHKCVGDKSSQYRCIVLAVALFGASPLQTVTKPDLRRHLLRQSPPALRLRGDFLAPLRAAKVSLVASCDAKG
jgi:hypothetical protein